MGVGVGVGVSMAWPVDLRNGLDSSTNGSSWSKIAGEGGRCTCGCIGCARFLPLNFG